jgi:hypothetical protein
VRNAQSVDFTQPAPELRRVKLTAQHGQPSWRLASDRVEGWVTRQGGHLAPVQFVLPRLKVQPFAIAPWATESVDRATPAMLRSLRGDFFCMPFGGNETAFRAERHPPHGETANSDWSFESLVIDGPHTTLELVLNTRIRRASVTKRLRVTSGHTAVYSQHVVRDATGPMSYGHHPCLRFPDEPGCGHLSTSPFVYGRVFPGQFEDPARGGYSCLKPGAEFISLRAVPLAIGGTADLTRYPARRGFEDLVLLVSEPVEPFAWAAVTFPKSGWAWFQLKNPAVLPSTILWISNGGRHYAPWNGRHTSVLGLEDVCADFHYGLAESAGRNPLAKLGHATHRVLSPRAPLVVNFIMGVAPIPRGFDEVKSIAPDGDGIVLVAQSGKSSRVPLDTAFLRSAA